LLDRYRAHEALLAAGFHEIGPSGDRRKHGVGCRCRSGCTAGSSSHWWLREMLAMPATRRVGQAEVYAFGQGSRAPVCNAFAEMDQLRRIPYRAAANAPVSLPSVDRMRCVIVAGLLVTSTMVALLAVSQLINYAVFDMRLRAFDTDYHSSVFGIVSLLAEAAAALSTLRRWQRHWRACSGCSAG
jgi:hypothetical protein